MQLVWQVSTVAPDYLDFQGILVLLVFKEAKVPLVIMVCLEELGKVVQQVCMTNIMTIAHLQ